MVDRDIESNFKFINFSILEKDTNNIRIKQVKCGSNEDSLTIKIETLSYDYILIWKIMSQTEQNMY
jgi:hypothetical protein